MVNELIAKMMLDSSEFIKEMNKTTKELKEFGKQAEKVGKDLTKYLTAPIAGIGAAALASAVKVGNYADTLLDLEQQTGLTTDSLQTYRAVATEAGIATDAVANAAMMLQRRFATGEEGSKELTDGLNRLGIAAHTTEGSLRPMDDIMRETIASLAEMEDITERNQLAIKIFGRNAMELAPLLSMGAKGIDEAAAKAEKLGLIMGRDSLEAANAFRIEMDFLKQTFNAVMNEIGVAVIPIMQSLVGMIQKNVVPIIRELVSRFNQISDAGKKKIAIFAGILAAIGPVVAMLGFFASTVLPAIIAGFAAILSPVGLAVASIAALAAAVIYVVDNWEALKERITDLSWWRNALISMVQWIIEYNPTSLLMKGINQIITFFKGDPIPDPFEGVSNALEGLKTETKEYKNEFGDFGDAVKNAGKKAMDALFGVKEEAKAANEEVNSFIGTPSTGGRGMRALVAVSEQANKGLVEMGSTLTALVPPLQLTGVNMDDLSGRTRYQAEMQQFWANVLMDVDGALIGLFDSMLNGGNAFEFIGRMLKRLVAQLAAAAAMAALLNALMGGGGLLAGAAKSVTNGASGFGNIFKGLLGFSVPALASGGMTLGPTLAMIGDNPSGKEAIIPFERMGEFMAMANAGNASAQTITVQGVLRGEDIFISSQQYTNRTQRRLGL